MTANEAPDIRIVSSADVLAGAIAYVSFATLLGDAGAVVFRDIFTTEEVREMVATIYGLREHWLPGFEEEQFSVGRVWYVDVADEAEAEYHQDAARTNAQIEERFGGTQERIRAFCSAIQPDDPVLIRPGWAGPGFVIFPAHAACAEWGGDIHFDIEGLAGDLLDDPEAEAFSFIAMLQKPETGGGLRVWREQYDPERRDEYIPELQSEPEGPSFLIDYRVGDLVMINSRAIHQIQPFGGDTDRITLTFHIVRRSGAWHIWFSRRGQWAVGSRQ
ncbi:MAG: hypothetical protein HYX51_05535 [Chloroflexi bacterium]|nr:hypothetical protein [Chloroflexota bacterium]